MANEDQQTAWFPAPYLEEVAPSQGQEGHLLLENSGESTPHQGGHYAVREGWATWRTPRPSSDSQMPTARVPVLFHLRI